MCWCFLIVISVTVILTEIQVLFIFNSASLNLLLFCPSIFFFWTHCLALKYLRRVQDQWNVLSFWGKGEKDLSWSHLSLLLWKRQLLHTNPWQPGKYEASLDIDSKWEVKCVKNWNGKATERVYSAIIYLNKMGNIHMFKAFEQS